MLEYLGLLAAFIAAIFWGSQFVPLKRIKNPDMLHYHAFMAVGIFMISVILTLAFGFPFYINYFGLVAGLVWGIGNILHITAVKSIGLAKGTAIPLGTSLVVSFLFGVFFFNESLIFLLGALGIIVFLVGLPFITYSPEKVMANKTGIAAAFIAGTLFGSVLVFFKLGNLGTGEFLFPLSVSVLVLGIILFFARVRRVYKSHAYHGIASGVLWGTAMLSAIYAVDYLGLAVGQPLTQLALIIAVLWGLFYFKEIKNKKTVFRVLLGSILLFLAGVILTLSKI